jgi:hypothetical protein
MTNDELRDLLCRLGEALRYDCLQTEKVRGLIGEVDAAIDALLPDDAAAAESHSARSEP